MLVPYSKHLLNFLPWCPISPAQSNVAQPLDKKTVKTAHVEMLDRGTCKFQVGVKARTSTVVTECMHAVVWGQVQSIDVHQMFYSEADPEALPEPGPQGEPERER